VQDQAPTGAAIGERSLLLLSTADTDLLTVSRARPAELGRVELGNPARLGEGDLAALCEAIRAHRHWAVGLRLLGGRRAFAEGCDRLREACREAGVPLLLWPGEPVKDAELEALSTAPPALLSLTRRYWEEGGIHNAANLLRALSDGLHGTRFPAEAPRPVPRHGIHRDGRGGDPGQPVIAIAFYRAHWMSGNLDFVDALCGAIAEAGGRPHAFFCTSLREPGPRGLPAAVDQYLVDPTGSPLADCLVLTLSFSVAEVSLDAGRVADTWASAWMERLGIPVVQAVTSTSRRDDWAGSSAGLSPLDVAMQVALPEMDGRIAAPPFSFKEEVDGLVRYVADPERCRAVARVALAHARLRRVPPTEKRVAIVLSSYPTRNGRVGNAVGLDTPASALALLQRLAAEGYSVGELPASGDELIQELIAAGTYERERLRAEQMRRAAARQPAAAYRSASARLAAPVRDAIGAAWGPPPGRLYLSDGHLHFAGLRFGNVLLTVQPPRGFGENPVAIYHDPTLAPTHHYTAYYRWLEEDFQAHAIVHLGKHGTLEWLPGKSVGLSAACFPDALLGSTPVVYPFVVNDPGEGVQAKRRAHAVIVDHLIPPMTRAESYGRLAELEQLMDEYYQVQTLDPAKLPRIRDRIWTLVREASLDRDLGAESRPEDFDSFILHIDGYICELKDAQIRGGLHVLGQPPDGERLVDLVVELTRRDNEGIPGLRALLEGDGGAPARQELDSAHERARELVRVAVESGSDAAIAAAGAADLAPTLRYIGDSLLPRLRRTTEELDGVVRGLAGAFVPPGPSGAPTRGMAHVLPTGRNFYSVDPKALPSPAACEVGAELAEALLRRHLEEEGRHPDTVGIVVWGTAAMRTHGDDIGEILHLLGTRPRWDPENRRVTGLEVIPAAQLGRPRIDVAVRISGFFRDAFPNLVHLIDEAVSRVAVLDEDDSINHVAKHFREERARKLAAGMPAEAAQRSSLYRIFGSPPGAYGAGILPLVDAGNWSSTADLARAYEAWGAFAYSRAEHGVDAVPEFRHRFAHVEVAVKNQDNREHDILDSDDYLQYHGGMIATVRALTGRAPRSYHGDSADPSRVRVRGLTEEVRRVMRTRALNPRWIRAMMEHGYKGGFELAATTDYLFGYDATADCAEDWMYAGLAGAYALDGEVQAWLREKNPWALLGIVDRLLEAAARGLWERPENELLARLRRLRWDLDAYLEGWGEGRRAEPARAPLPDAAQAPAAALPEVRTGWGRHAPGGGGS
jgi:cobaltochelatase CobN